MAKSSNPADAHRKMLRAKEVKKNKEARKSAREVAVVKKDTRCKLLTVSLPLTSSDVVTLALEADIRTLTAKAQKAPLSAADKAELEAARTELAKVTKAKTECELSPYSL